MGTHHRSSSSLCLSAPRNGPFARAAVHIPVSNPIRMADVHARHLRMRHLIRRLPCHRRAAPPPRMALPLALDLLLIRRGIETNKQQQITTQNAHARERGKLLAGAFSHVREVREVGAGEVGPGGEVDEAEVDDELQDLELGDVLFPPDADAARGLEVVPVHDDVDEEVERDGHPGGGGDARKLGVAEEGGGAVVVGVEEGWECVSDGL